LDVVFETICGLEKKMESGEFNKEADWRCHTVVRIAACTTVPGLGTLPAGTIGKAVGIVDYQSVRIGFSIPNATALFLNLSHSHYQAASAISKTFSLAPSLQTLNDDISFSYLENIMASIVFAYTALESFANEEIPDDFTYAIEKSKCTEVYDKTQIERFLTLEVKIGIILPIIFGVSTPKGNKIWENYLALESLRHSIIHMKKLDRDHFGDSSRSVWSKLISTQVPNSAVVSKSIMDHFYVSRSLKPHWYENFPFIAANEKK
jgi:hypothetical protein